MKTKFTSILLAALLLILTATGCAAGSANENAPADGGEETAQQTTVPTVDITFKDRGTVTVELDRDAAPITVDNFLKLANDGFYDGLTIHRISPGFVIQGGDPEGTGAGGSDENIYGEFAANGWDKNTISHKRGVISMARNNLSMDSASSQFFIVLEDAEKALDGKYAAFGEVTQGMEIVDEIGALPTDYESPLESVVIESVKVR
jgi:peptidyl-prolyl cis-trans isomerase B (cyclophilin B)